MIWCKPIPPSRRGDVMWRTLYNLWTLVLLSSIPSAISTKHKHMESIILKIESFGRKRVQ